MADLSLNDAERAYLAAQGLEAVPDGTWHSAVSGRTYSDASQTVTARPSLARV